MEFESTFNICYALTGVVDQAPHTCTFSYGQNVCISYDVQSRVGLNCVFLGLCTVI